MGQRKNLSPQQELNLWPSIHQSDALTTELQRTHAKLGHIQGLYIPCILHTARISDAKVKLPSFFIYHTHDDFDIADPNSMQDACLT